MVGRGEAGLGPEEGYLVEWQDFDPPHASVDLFLIRFLLLVLGFDPDELLVSNINNRSKRCRGGMGSRPYPSHRA